MDYIDGLLAEALITAPGCPETVVERILRTSCVAFYRETNAWRVTTDPIPVIQGRREVELELPADTMACRVYWARLAGRDMRAISPRFIQSHQAPPGGYAFIGNQATFQMDTLPDRTYTRDGLEVHLSVAPTNRRNELPDDLYAAHRDGILYGTQARLLAMPNVSWGDLNTAMAMASLAESEKAKARREAESAQSPVARSVRYGGI